MRIVNIVFISKEKRITDGGGRGFVKDFQVGGRRGGVKLILDGCGLGEISTFWQTS